jgi:membrane-associated phospholipid phosphatase
MMPWSRVGLSARTLLVLLCAVPAAAEPNLQFPSASARQASDIMSWGTVLGNLTLDTVQSAQCADRVHCFKMQAIRDGVTLGAVVGVKALVHRLRPCAPDCGRDDPDASFFSGHTAFAFSALGGPRLSFALPLAIGTGGMRVTAGKHWLTDVLVGAGVGTLTSRIR